MTHWHWIMLIPKVIIALTFLLYLAHLMSAIKKHGWLSTAGRWLTGVSLHHGKDWMEARFYWTDAGWFTHRRDIRVLHRSRRASKWEHLNLATRTTLRGGGLLSAAGLLVARAVTIAVLCVCAAGLLGWRVRRQSPTVVVARVRQLMSLRGVRHTQGRVRPFAEALASVAGTSPRAIRPALVWNDDYANAEPGAEVARWRPLPAGFKATGQERKLVEELWAARTGLDLVPQWKTAAKVPELVLTRARTFPLVVTLNTLLADGHGGQRTVRDLLDGLDADRTGLGADDSSGLVVWDWGVESPHALVNAGSRHGKSELLRSLVAQVLARGGGTTLVDVKRVSLQGMDGLPGLRILADPRDIRGMWQGIIDFHEEMEHRIDARAADPTVEFERNLLIIEEVNMASDMWDDWWEQQEIEDPRDAGTLFWKTKRARKTPPVWRHIKHVAWEGAFVNCNLLVVGQNLDGPTLKGLRNALQLRCLGGYQPQNWKALVGTTPIPPAPPQRGRFCLVSGSKQTWVQTLIADLDPDVSAGLWRDYVRERRPAVPVPDAAPDLPLTSAKATSGTGTGTSSGRAGLAEAVRDGVVGCSLESIRKYRQRDAAFPAPCGLRGKELMYDTAELAQWWTARDRTIV